MKIVILDDRLARHRWMKYSLLISGFGIYCSAWAAVVMCLTSVRVFNFASSSTTLVLDYSFVVGMVCVVLGIASIENAIYPRLYFIYSLGLFLLTGASATFFALLLERYEMFNELQQIPSGAFQTDSLNSIGFEFIALYYLGQCSGGVCVNSDCNSISCKDPNIQQQYETWQKRLRSSDHIEDCVTLYLQAISESYRSAQLGAVHTWCYILNYFVDRAKDICFLCTIFMGILLGFVIYTSAVYHIYVYLCCKLKLKDQQQIQ